MCHLQEGVVDALLCGINVFWVSVKASGRRHCLPFALEPFTSPDDRASDYRNRPYRSSERAFEGFAEAKRVGCEDTALRTHKDTVVLALLVNLAGAPAAFTMELSLCPLRHNMYHGYLTISIFSIYLYIYLIYLDIENWRSEVWSQAY
jgi:hypothetical protein